jgi:dipeptidyl aminopeptidase/acylaminoacyl peptidase
MRFRQWALGIAGAAVATAAWAADAPLIPRKTFFGNPDRAAPKISPDGTRLAWTAPVDGVMNVWVAPIGDLAAGKPVTADKKRGVTQYEWAFTNQHLLYMQDENGDENDHVFRVDLASNDVKDLTPLKGVKATLDNVSEKFPTEVAIGLNDGLLGMFHSPYKVNIVTGDRQPIFKNTQYLGVEIDDDYKVRHAAKFAKNGGLELTKFDAEGKPSPWMTVPPEDALTTQPKGFDKSGKGMYFVDSRGRNTAALFHMDEAGKTTLIAANDKADVGGVALHPTEKTVQAVGFAYDRLRWQFFDKAFEADFREVEKLCPGDANIVSRSFDDTKWIAAFLRDDGPVNVYMFDRTTKKGTFLFTNRKSLEGLALAPMRPLVVKARDGLEMVCYLTLPAGVGERPAKPLSTVLFIHGGPWARDAWGYNPVHQLLANRGYAVMSVNYRGSTGFGKAHLNAANKQWGKAMHTDLLDAADYLVKEGYSDRAKIAIMGGSYGGYATLAGLTLTPEVFCCGVDIVGPSNLKTLLSSIPAYWGPAKTQFLTRMGDPADPADSKMLDEVSPLTHAGKIVKPLLIGQGANDPRVKQAESDQIVAAMTKNGIPVSYILFPDEGHGFKRPENSIAFFAVTEVFLAKHLGGRCEPLEPSAFEKSTIQAPAGAALIEGLAASLPKPAAKPVPAPAESK